MGEDGPKVPSNCHRGLCGVGQHPANRQLQQLYVVVLSIQRITTSARRRRYVFALFHPRYCAYVHLISEQSLGVTNGRFGDCHRDTGDSPTHLSCATVLSDLPTEEGWEPGRMHFLDVGFYTTLEPL